jgi:hypothetical protein
MRKISLSNMGLTLAADDDQAEFATKLRGAGDGMLTCIASIEEFLEEPLKSKFLSVKKQINTMLAALPPTDQAPAAMQSNAILSTLLNVLSFAQSMMSDLTSATKSSREALNSTRAGMTAEIDNAIKAKRTSKELFDKTELDATVAEAVKTAVAAERKTWEVEIKQVSDRRSALTTAGLPVPKDERLKGDDATFAAAQTKAKERIDKVNGLKVTVAPERLLTLAWDIDDPGFENALGLLKDATTQKSGKANGFVSASTDAADLKTRVGAI